MKAFPTELFVTRDEERGELLAFDNAEDAATFGPGSDRAARYTLEATGGINTSIEFVED